MSNSSTLLPFQPMSMTTAQLAAVSFLARYAGHTHKLYSYQLHRWFEWCEGSAFGAAQSRGVHPLPTMRGNRHAGS